LRDITRHRATRNCRRSTSSVILAQAGIPVPRLESRLRRKDQHAHLSWRDRPGVVPNTDRNAAPNAGPLA
jgi:hypothetical protein